LHLEDYLTTRHVDVMSKMILAMSCLVGLAYGIEFFTAFYSGSFYETFAFMNRVFGPLAWAFAGMIASLGRPVATAMSARLRLRRPSSSASWIAHVTVVCACMSVASLSPRRTPNT